MLHMSSLIHCLASFIRRLLLQGLMIEPLNLVSLSTSRFSDYNYSEAIE